jgi:uncharacterized membrane protein
MAEMEHTDGPRAPDEGLVAWTHVIYGLHSLAVLIGATSAATVVGAFVFSVPSIIAVVLSYLKRSEAAGTYLASHYRWLIRTFWFSFMWGVLGAIIFFVLLIIVIGPIIAIAIWIVTTIWVLYRLIRGYMLFKDSKPVPGM